MNVEREVVVNWVKFGKVGLCVMHITRTLVSSPPSSMEQLPPN